MKRIIQFLCRVDHYKPPKFKHTSVGLYQVAAKTQKEARSLVQSFIGFGSVGKCIEIPEEFIRDDYDYSGEKIKHLRLPYKMVTRIMITRIGG